MIAPGRALDLLVAEHVMGYRRVLDDTADYDGTRYSTPVLLPPGYTTLAAVPGTLPPRGQIALGYFVSSRYSTHIADAWLVVEYMRAQGYRVGVQEWLGEAGIFEAMFTSAERGRRATARAVPLAICLAALKAVGYTEQQ